MITRAMMGSFEDATAGLRATATVYDANPTKALRHIKPGSPHLPGRPNLLVGPAGVPSEDHPDWAFGIAAMREWALILVEEATESDTRANLTPRALVTRLLEMPSTLALDKHERMADALLLQPLVPFNVRGVAMPTIAALNPALRVAEVSLLAAQEGLLGVIGFRTRTITLALEAIK